MNDTVQKGRAAEKRHGQGGRPSRLEAEIRERRLVEVAAALFMERGFDATSVDAVAETAGVSKATLYAHYRDKADLFAAVLCRQIDQLFDGVDQLAADSGGAEEVLLTLGRRAIEMAVRSEAVAMYRIIIAQAHKFPALGELIDREGFQRGSANIAKVLQRLAIQGEIQVDDHAVAAELFLSLVIGRQSRMAMLGLEIDPRRSEERLQASVRLFLRGVGHGSQKC